MKRTAKLLAMTTLFAAMTPFAAIAPTWLAHQPSNNALVAMLSSTALAAGQGNFVTARYATQGTVQIVTDEDGQKYLEFDEAFQTNQGPDLFVLLHKEDNPQSYDSTNYINLGRLQTSQGRQRYAIPGGTQLEDFKSVVIWCRQFNVTFGFAQLSQT